MMADNNEFAKFREKLSRLEASQEETKRTLARVLALMDGDPSYRIVGFPDQLAAYIKANEDWKKATEKRIGNNEDRLEAIEGNKQIVIAPTTAALLVVIGALCLILAYMALTWLQG